MCVLFSGTKKSRKRPKLGRAREIARDARMRGDSYVNYKKSLKPAKTPKLEENLCGSNCRLKCSSRFNAEVRQKLFLEFYSLHSEAQSTLLLRSMNIKDITRITSAKRSCNITYSVSIQGNNEQVCKPALQSIYQIGRGRLDILRRKVTAGVSSPAVSHRGRHCTRPNKTPDNQLREVREHINMFPAEASHYSRNKNPHKLYLASDLSIPKLYELYNMFCGEKEYVPVSLNRYTRIFTEDFNLSFGVPKTDTCGTCDSKKSDQVHVNMYKAAFEMQKHDKKKASECDETCFITFDLEKTLPLPKISTNVAFYLRKLWLYNLGVHCVTKELNRAYFHVWSENEGGRGSEEIASCLMAFVNTMQLQSNKSHLIAWSDSCAGQNKNIYLIMFWQYLILAKKFKIIDHKFPEVGHSYMDSDRDFALVEKKINRCQSVQSVDQYVNLMMSANTKNKPIVTMMADKFINIKELGQQLNLIHNTKNTIGKKVNFQKGIRWIRVEEFGIYKYRESLSEEEPWKEVDLNKKRCETLSSQPMLSSKVRDNKEIDAAKWNDIQKLLPYLDEVFRGFFQSLKKKN